jgi:ATP-dependent RNA helicase SUPV3L1/SUV3
MTEDESSPTEDAPLGAPETPTPTPPDLSPAFDFSGLRGFQSLDAATVENGEAYQVELVKELVARAERFVQSVDGAIVLASDGVIRWLGDPVARLVSGEELLKPRAVLLADDSLPEENREAVDRRLSLWVAAHIHKILGPLEALAGAEGAAAAEVAQKVVEALGVLDREQVRRQVKTLDQNARAALRKLGVRFGANYIFVPALLKPGARALCLQLWSLKHGAEPDSDKLLAYASAGRTSFPVDGVLSANAYRIAGFRLCGERVVRVDIVERLTDLIRAAIPDLMRQSGGGGGAAGFVVTQQMTSLTGCAGEAFSSILRSLGFESHQVKKSEHDATRRKPEPPKSEATAEEGVEETAEAHEAGETHEAAETHEAVEVHDAEVQAEAEEVVAEAAASEGEFAVATDADDSPEPASAESEAPQDEPQHDEPQQDEAAAEEAPKPVAEVVEATELAAGPELVAEADAVAEPEPVAEAEPVVDLEPVLDLEPVAETAAEPAVDEAEPAPAVEEDPLIEVWRPAPRRQGHQHHQHHHHNRQKTLPPEGTGRIVWRAKPEAQRRPAPTPDSAPEALEGAPAPQGETPQRQGRGHGGRGNGGQGHGSQGHGGQGHGGQGRPDRGGGPSFKEPKRDDRRDDRPPRKEPRPAVVDPDSPFAKLAALRPLLERRDKRN